MKKIYTGKLLMMSGFMTLLLCLGTSAMAQFPVPDQAFNFNDEDTAYHTEVTDISGNNNHGYWWAYREGTDDMYAKYDPDGGVFGGSWHISGYHICCEEMASPSMDFILLAGNHNENKDAEGFTGTSPLYHEGFESFTVAFWFKSGRDYKEGHTPCPPILPGMHEQEILFSLGGANGVAVQNFKGYYEVRLGQKPPEGQADVSAITYVYNGEAAVEKAWQHIAVTFDGANNGALAVYIDGALGSPYLGDPNPLETGYSEIYPTMTSAEIGAQNNSGLFGNVSAFWGSANIGQYCITEEDTTYRTGWPAAGDYDDYVFYKNRVLTPEEIQQLVDDGITKLLGLSNVPANKTTMYSIYPNPAQDYIRVNGKTVQNVDLSIYNVLGARVLQKNVRPNSEVDISHLQEGIYIIKINNKHTSKLLVK